MHLIIFCISAVLLVWSALFLSRAAARTSADRFWTFLAAVLLQLGGITGLLSVFRQLNGAGWLVLQGVLFVTTLYFKKRGAFGGAGIRPRFWRWHAPTEEFFAGLSPVGLAALFCTIMLIALSGITQAFTPIHIGDEKMYHASRVIYWIQNQTAFPFSSHNDRQTVFTFGSELFFLWPTLLTRTEIIGRMIFWIAYPCAAIGQYLLARSMRLSRTVALIGTLILISTPLISESSVGLKPEMWNVVTLLGVAYWAAALCADPDRTNAKCFLLGLFTVLSINMRSFALVLFPSIVVIPFCVRSMARLRGRFEAVAGGLLTGLVLSGLLIPFGFNLARYHNILGPEGLRKVVAADLGSAQLYTHAVRLPFLLLELPDAPTSAGGRARISDVGNRIITALGAGAPLPLENENQWPGRYSYALPARASRFSLWGVLWLPALGFSAVLLVRNLLATWPEVKLTPPLAIALLSIPLLAAVVFGTRWMVDSGVPERFLIGPYALAVPIGVALAGPYVSGRKLFEAAALILIVFAVYQPIRAEVYKAIEAVAGPTARDIDHPFEEPLNLIPAGSCILFIGNNDAPDYPLFSPRMHYANRVVPWGKLPFDAKRMRAVISAEWVTHVLIQDDRAAFFHWDPAISTSEMALWLAGEPDIRETPLGTAHMRLFETSNNKRMNERPFRTMEAPTGMPLIYVDPTLRNQVGLDLNLARSPWAVEDLGGTEGAFLWIGQGQNEGVEFGVWSRVGRTARLRFDVSPGPSLETPNRTVSLFQDGAPVVERSAFQGVASLVFRTTIHPGRNLIRFFCLDSPSIKMLPNGDTRRLIIGLHDIHVEADSGVANK